MVWQMPSTKALANERRSSRQQQHQKSILGLPMEHCLCWIWMALTPSTNWRIVQSNLTLDIGTLNFGPCHSFSKTCMHKQAVKPLSNSLVLSSCHAGDCEMLHWCRPMSQGAISWQPVALLAVLEWLIFIICLCLAVLFVASLHLLL
jgi:hypothetical protein